MTKDEKKVSCIMIVVAFIIFIIWCVATLTAGEAGYTYVAINALFSGLAFCGIIWAILLQRIEIKIQREELRESRKEMSMTRKANQESAAMLEKQTNLINLQIRTYILSSIIETTLTARGSTHLKDTFNKLVKHYKSIPELIEELNEKYIELQKDFKQ